MKAKRREQLKEIHRAFYILYIRIIYVAGSNLKNICDLHSCIINPAIREILNLFIRSECEKYNLDSHSFRIGHTQQINRTFFC